MSAVPAGFEGRERFAAYVAHELRTPLATQRALLELVLADRNADTATWREIGRDVLRACRQQERLLEACLTLARSQTGLRRRARVELGSTVAEVVEGHDFRGLIVNLGLERAFVVGDRDLIERLVANLVTNAVRHNRAGGFVRLTTSADDDRAVLAIENTGMAVAAAEITRLFEPFQQLESPVAARSGGLGLGLAVVKAVADAHHASIAARARPGGGLRVEVAFPLG